MHDLLSSSIVIILCKASQFFFFLLPSYFLVVGFCICRDYKLHQQHDELDFAAAAAEWLLSVALLISVANLIRRSMMNYSGGNEADDGPWTKQNWNWIMCKKNINFNWHSSDLWPTTMIIICITRYHVNEYELDCYALNRRRGRRRPDWPWLASCVKTITAHLLKQTQTTNNSTLLHRNRHCEKQIAWCIEGMCFDVTCRLVTLVVQLSRSFRGIELWIGHKLIGYSRNKQEKKRRRNN